MQVPHVRPCARPVQIARLERFVAMEICGTRARGCVTRNFSKKVKEAVRAGEISFLF
jgi:hypothetical protein